MEQTKRLRLFPIQIVTRQKIPRSVKNMKKVSRNMDTDIKEILNNQVFFKIPFIFNSLTFSCEV